MVRSIGGGARSAMRQSVKSARGDNLEIDSNCEEFETLMPIEKTVRELKKNML